MGNNAICSTFTQHVSELYIIDNRQNQLFSEMSLRDIMELPTSRHLLTLVRVTSDKSLNLRWPES